MSSMTCFKHQNVDPESADMLSECSKISVAFTKLVIVLAVLIPNKWMNVIKLQMFEISVISFVIHEYSSHCFFCLQVSL